MRYFSFLICVFFSLQLHSQRDRSIDSLMAELRALNAKAGDPSLSDTARVKVLNALSRKFTLKGDHSTAIKHARIAENISNKLIAEGFIKEGKQCLANAIKNLGYAYNSHEDYPNALREYKKEIILREDLNDKKGQAICYNGIGTIYLLQENNALAMEYFFKALKLFEEIGNKDEITTVYNSLGICYNNQGNYEKALSYYKKELEIGELLNDKVRISISLSNIGAVYGYQGKHKEALENFKKFLAIAETGENKQDVALGYINLGSTYESLKEFDKGLEAQFKAIEILKQHPNSQYEALCYLNVGITYLSMIRDDVGNKQKNTENARLYLNKALAAYEKLGLPTYIGECYNFLSQLASTVGDHKSSFENYRKYISYKDSARSAENTTKSIRAEMNYEFEKKETAANIEQEKKEALAKEETAKQKAIRNLFIVAFGFMLLLASFIFISYRQKKQVNLVISSQKLEVEEQKALVEKNQKQIIDSINYAKRIQSSILPNDVILKKAIPESFIFYKPKDIVSGDFYWFCQLPATDDLLVAVADCTGHGVPGAFLSMVGSTLLNEIVTHKNITDPAHILKALCSGLSSTLVSKQKDEMNSDGMDISICKINITGRKLLFAGANQTLYLALENKIEKIESQINSISGVFDLRTNDQLESAEIDLSGVTAIYMTTDGYADQISEQTKKKFLSTRFENLLMEIHSLPAAQQLKTMDVTFTNWKGNQKQIDDILVIGMKI